MRWLTLRSLVVIVSDSVELFIYSGISAALTRGLFSHAFYDRWNLVYVDNFAFWSCVWPVVGKADPPQLLKSEELMVRPNLRN